MLLSSAADARAALSESYRQVRGATEALTRHLGAEDMMIQSMPDASPTKWHLAHTTWFFETFLLSAYVADYRPFDASFGYLFNSYYNAVGERIGRARRGLISRPTAEEVRGYRRAVDGRMLGLLDRLPDETWGAVAPLVTLGLHHEQQHQELILTDIKHAFGGHPLRPSFAPPRPAPRSRPAAPGRIGREAGLAWVGHSGEGFAFDNESPRHRVYVESFRIAERLVTCGEYEAFIADGGYRRPELWLSDGFEAARQGGWEAPAYWERRDGRWWLLTLRGFREVEPGEPVCHVSHYEADAYARWAGARLPTEAEWEAVAGGTAIEGNFVESGHYHPAAPGGRAGAGPAQLFGDVWEWTGSAYLPYPGYRPAAGALGEYNGKFMSGQMVLRGGSCATPRSHIRATYRNFFPPGARWQFSGIRLAWDADRGGAGQASWSAAGAGETPRILSIERASLSRANGLRM